MNSLEKFVLLVKQKVCIYQTGLVRAGEGEEDDGDIDPETVGYRGLDTL